MLGRDWKLLGEVAVDSAHVALVDPAYRSLIGPQWYEEPERDGARAIEGAMRAVGVIVRSGLGDGWYKVWGRFLDLPSERGLPQRRVLAELRLIFIEGQG